jgi:hypothetical protein
LVPRNRVREPAGSCPSSPVCVPLADAGDEAVTRVTEKELVVSNTRGRFGWVYEFQDRVAMTGAGAYHAGETSGGMLGG